MTICLSRPGNRSIKNIPVASLIWNNNRKKKKKNPNLLDCKRGILTGFFVPVTIPCGHTYWTFSHQSAGWREQVIDTSRKMCPWLHGFSQHFGISSWQTGSLLDDLIKAVHSEWIFVQDKWYAHCTKKLEVWKGKRGELRQRWVSGANPAATHTS